MEKRYSCYCGLYCENCATKARVVPAAKNLYIEMKNAGFEDFVQFLPGGDEFWSFLGSVAEGGACDSCREGAGNPGCAVRACAQKRGVELCALCGDYPCDLFGVLFEGYPVLREDNALLREKGMDAWSQLQDDRRSQGFAYRNMKIAARKGD